MLKPAADVQTVDDEKFLYRLFDITVAVINEPKLEEAAMEILLLFNLLNSSRAVIRRDDSDDTDAPLLISKIDKTGYNFPSRLRYIISLTILDIYELSCKPDILFKRIRHAAYQDKCKTANVAKYVTDTFLDALRLTKDSIYDENAARQENLVKQYDCFVRNHRKILDDESKFKRRQINEDIETVQSYPSLRRSLIEETLINVCKMSLSIERYVATRTAASMQNENYQYPCFVHFVAL